MYANTSFGEWIFSQIIFSISSSAQWLLSTLLDIVLLGLQVLQVVKLKHQAIPNSFLVVSRHRGQHSSNGLQDKFQVCQGGI